MPRPRHAFTLIEVLIVVVLMAVLAATVIPQFTHTTEDAKLSSTQYNLNTLRKIQLYKAQHNFLPSNTLAELAAKTNIQGQIGSGSEHNLGPYVREIPLNTITGSATVTVIVNTPAKASDVTASGGWLYNATIGEIWIDHADHFSE